MGAYLEFRVHSLPISRLKYTGHKAKNLVNGEVCKLFKVVRAGGRYGMIGDLLLKHEEGSYSFLESIRGFFTVCNRRDWQIQLA